MEELKHECGVALVRLRKAPEYYVSKYGTQQYALSKLYLLMQKQHNRGQEGAGLACVSLGAEAGEEFMFRERKEGKDAITELFSEVGRQIAADPRAFAGECYMGHLRYSTTGRSGLTYVHPHLRRNGYRWGTLALCGNFNLTNVDEVFGHLQSRGQHPRRTSDTTVLLEQLGDSLDRNHGDTEAILHECMPLWDGGFVICGMTGAGEMFAARDPWGIRSAFWYADDEIIVVASERPAIQTVMNLSAEQVHEIAPGEALFISAEGEISHREMASAPKITPCSFERIYFSRGSDRDIYLERKELGRAVVPQVLEAIGGDLDNTVFSFIPNTAEIAFSGMIEGLGDHLDREKLTAISALPAGDTTGLRRIVSRRVRTEKVAVKDIKLRTFISESGERNELAGHVYDITYGSIRPEVDNLVVIDDSIVRGTTLRRSIITILSRLRPRKLVIVSSAPQIRYPDFYGIDMSNIGDLIAFRAALAMTSPEKLEQIYQKCLAQLAAPKEDAVNPVAEIYTPFTYREVSKKIAELVTSAEVTCPVEIIFQEQAQLARICRDHSGDWYFSGNYPTAGGVRQLCRTFVDFYEATQR
jgi:amidophosphoribosyltransferase